MKGQQEQNDDLEIVFDVSGVVGNVDGEEGPLNGLYFNIICFSLYILPYFHTYYYIFVRIFITYKCYIY